MTDKTRQTPLTIPQKYALMHSIKHDMPDAGFTDTEFAAKLAKDLGRPVHPSTVTSYREAFGITAYKAPTPAELRAKVRELQAQLDLRGERAAA